DERNAGQNHSALEAATGRELSMSDGIEAKDDQWSGEKKSKQVHGVAHWGSDAVWSEVERRINLFVFGLAQQDHGAHDRCEQNEFLAQRVEAAVVEVDGGDGVGDVTLVNDDGVEDVAIRAGIMPQTGQATQSP